MEYKIALCVVVMSAMPLTILNYDFIKHKSITLFLREQKKIIATFVTWDFWFILLPIYTFHKTYITLFVNVEKIIILLLLAAGTKKNYSSGFCYVFEISWHNKVYGRLYILACMCA